MIKSYIRKILPRWIQRILRPISGRVKRLFIYNPYDSSAYWIMRASESSETAVLWNNVEYNHLFRRIQYNLLYPYIKCLQYGSRVLDIGCGIAVVTEMMLTMNPNILIDSVDFPEMIAKAKSQVKSERVRFIPCSAESYLIDSESYDLILSSACYSSIRDIQKLKKALSNGAIMLKPGGRMLMIDPFHRCNYLARAKYGPHDVVQFVKRYNINLENKSGCLFWPFREWLANSRYTGAQLANRFSLGERLLSIFGKHFWADYKILIFRKQQ